jgi:TPR repeat protein
VTSSLGGGTIALIPGSLASISSPSSEAERAWASVKDSASIGQLEVIASHYEGTVYADLARARIEELKDVLRKQRLAKQSSEKESLAPPAPSKLVLPPPKRAEQPLTPAERLLSMGQKWLDQGNISAARAFLQRAADAGSADAALAMGTTYDPAEQTRLALFGVVPDRNEARKWYERARDLGSAEAETRLARLAQQ